MPRSPRIHVDGVPLHIVQRGHNCQFCFFAAGDYLAYLQCLGDAARSTGCQIHAYALMTNHVHLLLTPGDAPAASRVMVALGRRYVPYINASYQRSGMCTDPAHYRWSSYRANTLGESTPLLTPHPLYATLGAGDASR